MSPPPPPWPPPPPRGALADRQRDERAFGRGGQRPDRVARHGQLLRAARQPAPVDADFRHGVGAGVGAARFGLRGQPLRFVVDVAIAGIAIAIAQREHPQLRRRGDAALRRDAVAEAFGRREQDVLAVGGPHRFVLGEHQRVVGDVTLFAAADRRDVDVRAQRAILLRHGDPLAVRRDRDRSDAADVVLADDGRLAVVNGVVVELSCRRRRRAATSNPATRSARSSRCRDR